MALYATTLLALACNEQKSSSIFLKIASSLNKQANISERLNAVIIFTAYSF